MSKRCSFFLSHNFLLFTTKQTKHFHVQLILKCALQKGPHDWNNRTVEDMEDDADCNCSVCKYTLCYLLSLVPQPNWGLGWLFVEVHRSQTVRHRHTRQDSPDRLTSWLQTSLPTRNTKARRPISTLLPGSYPRYQEWESCRSTAQTAQSAGST